MIGGGRVGAWLDAAGLVVDPGGEVTAVLRVRNNASVVDEFSFEVLDSARSWVRVEPVSVALFPGAETSVVVRFEPRPADVVPGPTPFAIKVVSRVDPAAFVVEEGSICVGRLERRTIELDPSTARGRRHARIEVAVDNYGNAPIEVSFAGVDAENACRYRFTPAVLRVAPGKARFTRLRVSAGRFWTGPNKTYPFQIVVSEPEGEPSRVDGTFVQKPVLSPGVVKSVAVGAVIVLALFVLSQTVFKSTVESVARATANEPIDDSDTADAATTDTAIDDTVAADTPIAPTAEPDSGATTTTDADDQPATGDVANANPDQPSTPPPPPADPAAPATPADPAVPDEAAPAVPAIPDDTGETVSTGDPAGTGDTASTGNTGGAPLTVYAPNENSIHVFGTAENGTTYTAYWDGAAWHGWVPFGTGTIAGGAR